MDTPYLIVYAQTVETKYGTNVILTLQDSAAGMIKVFLTRQYGIIFTDAVMNAINEISVTRALKYFGTCPNSKAFMLNIV
jgi:DNA-binding NarL/FixJ family response regulator